MKWKPQSQGRQFITIYTLAVGDESGMNDSVVRYFRCPESYSRFSLREPLSVGNGYFNFGPGTTCYGRCAGHSPSSSPEEVLPDLLADATIEGGTVCLPFDLKQVVDNLRYELYSQEASSQGKPRWPGPTI